MSETRRRKRPCDLWPRGNDAVPAQRYSAQPVLTETRGSVGVRCARQSGQHLAAVRFVGSARFAAARDGSRVTLTLRRRRTCRGRRKLALPRRDDRYQSSDGRRRRRPRVAYFQSVKPHSLHAGQTSLFNGCARGSEVGTNRPFKQRPGISGIPSVRSGKMERSLERRCWRFFFPLLFLFLFFFFLPLLYRK